jgi:hypothetical protein
MSARRKTKNKQCFLGFNDSAAHGWSAADKPRHPISGLLQGWQTNTANLQGAWLAVAVLAGVEFGDEINNQATEKKQKEERPSGCVGVPNPDQPRWSIVRTFGVHDKHKILAQSVRQGSFPKTFIIHLRFHCIQDASIIFSKNIKLLFFFGLSP